MKCKYLDPMEMVKEFQQEVSTFNSPDMDLATGGVDSFAVMKLVDKISEEIGIEVNPTSAFQWGTPTKIAAGIKDMIENPGAEQKPLSAAASAAPAAPAAPAAGAAKESSAPVMKGRVLNMPEGATEIPPFCIDAPEDTLENLMAHLGLSEYTPALVDDGYDDVKIIQLMEDDEFNEICTDAKMKKGHIRKFKMWKDVTNPKLAK